MTCLDCEPETRTDVSVVLVVIDVLVSPSSVVTECYEDVTLDSDWECVELQSFSFSQKRSDCAGRASRRDELRGEMPVKAPPNTRRRMMPRISHSSTGERQWQAEMEVQGIIWTARETKVIATDGNLSGQK